MHAAEFGATGRDQQRYCRITALPYPRKRVWHPSDPLIPFLLGSAVGTGYEEDCRVVIYALGVFLHHAIAVATIGWSAEPQPKGSLS
jgi:hypothetical protein